MNFRQKYALVISFPEKKIDFNFIKTDPKADIKKDYLNFSKSEKKIFTLIQNAKKWKEEIDQNEILDLLEDISFNLYFKNQNIQEIDFSDEKLKIEIKLQENKTFLLKLDEKIVFFHFTNSSIFYFKDNLIYKISSENKLVLNILKRIFLKKFHKNKISYSENFQTLLSDDEITKINEILKELKKLFNLETELPEEFILEEIKSQKEELEIFYDQEENILEIQPILNYEIQKVPISKSIFFSKSKDKHKFVRKHEPAFGIEFLIKIEGNKIFWNKINSEKELDFYKNIFAFYKELGFNSKLELKRKGKKQIETFIQKEWKKIDTLPYSKIFLKDKLNFEVVDFRADLDFNYQNEKTDLLDLKADFYLGNEKVDLENLKKIIKNKKNQFLNLGGKLYKIKNKEEVEKLISLLNKFEAKEKAGLFEGKLYQITEIENIFNNSEFYKKKISEGYKKFLKEAENFKENQNIEIPEKYKTFLRPYQIEGIQWLSFLKKYHFGGILADDMGLGKTVQTLIFLDLNKSEKPSLVIVPKSLLGNWKSEAEKFTTALKTCIISGDFQERKEKIKNLKKYNLAVTSYSSFQRDLEIYKENNINFFYTILDEAQYIKNFKTKNAVRVKEIDSEFRLALSGTPIENSLSEIWSVFEFLMPNFLGSFSDFSKNYIVPIKNGNKKKLDILQKKISIFMLRRQKKEVLKELPEKTEQKLFIDLSPEQSLLYNKILEKVKSDFSVLNEENFKKSYIHILAALTRLRQVCNHPNLILSEEDYQKYNSEKLNIFKSLIAELLAENRKVLVFSQFTKMLDILEAELKKEKIDFSRLDGKTKNRAEIIDDFNQDKDKKIFLISLKAGGLGLNLTSADSVIIFDPWWNPSTENQAIDRSHRIGQKKSVNVFKLITKNTIEEKILKLQKEKQNLFDSLIGNSEKSFKKLDWKDIKDIFEM